MYGPLHSVSLIRLAQASRIKDTLKVAKVNGHAIVLLGCRLKLPAELEHEFTNIDFSLRGPEQLATVLDGIAKSAKLKKKDLPDESRRTGCPAAIETVAWNPSISPAPHP